MPKSNLYSHSYLKLCKHSSNIDLPVTSTWPTKHNSAFVFYFVIWWWLYNSLSKIKKKTYITFISTSQTYTSGLKVSQFPLSNFTLSNFTTSGIEIDDPHPNKIFRPIGGPSVNELVFLRPPFGLGSTTNESLPWRGSTIKPAMVKYVFTRSLGNKKCRNPTRTVATTKQRRTRRKTTAEVKNWMVTSSKNH